ncbi:MAG: HNH endonuclease, partial [Planctomycetota bacterium]|nr:HNH endonuclease [Planctomycetota bacterium]
MRQFKTCASCGKKYSKNYFYSENYWKVSKYCSRKCYGQSLKGKPSGRKGKKWSPEQLKVITEINRRNGLQHRGKNHHNWKGGRIRNSGGYVYILNLGHPFAKHRGYVAEHRLVVEKYLGRYLEPTEKVHHINNIKDDNRIKNL